VILRTTSFSSVGDSGEKNPQFHNAPQAHQTQERKIRGRHGHCSRIPFSAVNPRSERAMIRPYFPAPSPRLDIPTTFRLNQEHWALEDAERRSTVPRIIPWRVRVDPLGPP